MIASSVVDSITGLDVDLSGENLWIGNCASKTMCYDGTVVESCASLCSEPNFSRPAVETVDVDFNWYTMGICLTVLAFMVSAIWVTDSFINCRQQRLGGKQNY